MSNPQAAPVHLVLSGQEFLMSPFTDRDIGELNNFIRMQILASARDSMMTPGTPAVIVEATMKAAVAETLKIDWVTDPDLLSNSERIIYLFWMGIRNHPPRPSKTDFSSLLLQDWEKNFPACMDALQAVNPTLRGLQANQVVPEAPMA